MTAKIDSNPENESSPRAAFFMGEQQPSSDASLTREKAGLARRHPPGRMRDQFHASARLTHASGMNPQHHQGGIAGVEWQEDGLASQ